MTRKKPDIKMLELISSLDGWTHHLQLNDETIVEILEHTYPFCPDSLNYSRRGISKVELTWNPKTTKLSLKIFFSDFFSPETFKAEAELPSGEHGKEITQFFYKLDDCGVTKAEEIADKVTEILSLVLKCMVNELEGPQAHCAKLHEDSEKLLKAMESRKKIILGYPYPKSAEITDFSDEYLNRKLKIGDHFIYFDGSEITSRKDAEDQVISCGGEAYIFEAYSNPDDNTPSSVLKFFFPGMANSFSIQHEISMNDLLDSLAPVIKKRNAASYIVTNPFTQQVEPVINMTYLGEIDLYDEIDLVKLDDKIPFASLSDRRLLKELIALAKVVKAYHDQDYVNADLCPYNIVFNEVEESFHICDAGSIHKINDASLDYGYHTKYLDPGLTPIIMDHLEKNNFYPPGSAAALAHDTSQLQAYFDGSISSKHLTFKKIDIGELRYSIHKCFTKSAEVYQFAFIIAACFHKRYFYFDENERRANIEKSSLKGKKINSGLMESLHELVDEMQQPNAEQRPTMEQVIKKLDEMLKMVSESKKHKSNHKVHAAMGGQSVLFPEKRKTAVVATPADDSAGAACAAAASAQNKL